MGKEGNFSGWGGGRGIYLNLKKKNQKRCQELFFNSFLFRIIY